MILEMMGWFLLGMAVGCIVCSITVAVLDSFNLKDVSSEAIKNSGQDKAKELMGKALNAIVTDRNKQGDITTITLDMLDDEEKVGEVTINSEYVSSDITVGKRYYGIRI